LGLPFPGGWRKRADPASAAGELALARAGDRPVIVEQMENRLQLLGFKQFRHGGAHLDSPAL
jgi:hypothetical protein